MKPRYIKYSNQKHNGYDSLKEADVGQKLAIFERDGVISDLQRQVAFVLFPSRPGHRAVKYVADFVFIENGKRKVMDVKGFKTAIYKLKKRLMLEIHGIEIEEV